MQEAEVLPVSITSAYDKLGNLPLAVSETLLEEGTQRMNAVLPEIPAVDPLPGSAGRITKSSAPTARRSSMSNDCLSRCAVRGRHLARVSAGLNLGTGLAVAMVGHLDGEAGEAALTEVLLPKLAAAAGPGKQWVVVLDRLYCNLSFPQQVLKAGGHFLIRYCTNTTSFPIRPGRPGRAATPKGTGSFKSGVGWARLSKAGRQYVRRITKHLRDGKRDRCGHGPVGRGEVSGRGDA